MKYEATAFGRALSVELRPGPKSADGVSTFELSVNGNPPTRVEARLGGDVLQFRANGRLWRAVLPKTARGSLPESVFIRGESLPVSLRPQGAPAPGGPLAGQAGSVRVSSPMPGRVVAVRVAVGDRVERGDLLVTLEAMKMQNEFLAPASGRISRLQAVPGKIAAAGDVLVEIEPGAGRG